MSGIPPSALSPRAPNFFLPGAPKAGTTALYSYLDQHPAIYMSPIKEPDYFADEFRLDNFTDHFRAQAELRLPAQEEYLRRPTSQEFSGGPIANWADYLKLFECARDETAIGEASACYLWSPTAPANIAARFPDAKFLVMLRNPVERAFSQYAHMMSYAESPVTFREYLDAAMSSASTLIGELYPFLHFGLYSEQLRRYFSIFGPERISIHFYEDFSLDPGFVLRAMFRFLSVDAGFEPDLSARHMEARVPRSYVVMNALKRLGIRERLRGKLPSGLRKRVRDAVFQPRNALILTPGDRAYLTEYYRDDVVNLSKLLNRDLSSWLAAG